MSKDGEGERATRGRVRGIRNVPNMHSRKRGKAQAGASETEKVPTYEEARKELDGLVGELVALSVGIGGVPSANGRQYWSSVLLAKVTLTCMTLNSLVPRTASKSSREVWDLGSIATLVRGIAENYFLMHWLCVETEDEALWAFRIALLQLVDNRARYRMIDEIEGEEEPEAFVTAQRSHADHLATMELWHRIEPKRQKELLKGDRLPFIQDDVVEKLEVDRLSFRRLYRYLSSFVHTGTISFFRAEKQGRGNGEYNLYEANSILVCMVFANMVLGALIADMRSIHFKSDR